MDTNAPAATDPKSDAYWCGRLSAALGAVCESTGELHRIDLAVARKALAEYDEHRDALTRGAGMIRVDRAS